jgi:hypothetical protein
MGHGKLLEISGFNTLTIYAKTCSADACRHNYPQRPKRLNALRGPSTSLILPVMKSAQNIAGDIGRLGQFLGIGDRWTYFDVPISAAAAEALQRWALLRQLHEFQLPLEPSEARQA